ncbi:MAG: hypothetical protein JXB49_35570 [Bacteroidales bacterium]|nr:hypothetical protein [Bacteroidales bacterium]
MFNRINILSIVTVLLILINCGKKSEPTAPQNNETPIFEQSGIIGESGGQVEISDPSSQLFGTYVKIPENALKSNQTITINMVSEITTFQSDTSLTVVSLEPSAIQFEKPIEIGIPYKANENPSDLHVYFFDESNFLWKKLPKLGYDSDKSVIIAQTIHFTKFVSNYSNVEFDIELYNSNSKISAHVKLLTPLSEIKTDITTALGQLAGNYRQLLEKRTQSMNVVFIVKLKRKAASWFEFDQELDKKVIFYSIGEYSDGPGTVNAYEAIGDDIIHIIDFSTSGSYDQAESIYSGVPILFVFSENPSYNYEYYIELDYYFVHDFGDNKYIPPDAAIWGFHGYNVSTHGNSRKFSQLSDAPDHDNDRIIDEFDEIQGNIPVAKITSPSNNDSFEEGETINFIGEGIDAEDGNLSGSSLIWKSNHDGQIGTGTTFTTNSLSANTHVITLIVMDSGGNKNYDAINIYVTTPGNTAPKASFTVSPSSGTTDTKFSFDASNSSDSEDPTSALQVRWDWENDGIWDTDYTTAKTESHQFLVDGAFTVKLEVKDTGGLTGFATKSIQVSSVNTPPSASFSITPSSGTTDTNFSFDASNSSDSEDPISALQVRWDWENDGIWDTDFNVNKKETHKYLNVGTKTILMEVKDTGGLTSCTTKQLSISPGSNDVINITIVPENVTIKTGETYQFQCKAYDSNGTEVLITNLSTWSVNPGNAGYINNTGLFTADDNVTGEEQIIANYLNYNATATANVISASSQKWEIYNIENSQLPDNSIHSLCIESSNLIWIGTLHGGVASFNGFNWEIFNINNSALKSNAINDIEIDKNGTKWFVGGGVYSFDGTNWNIYLSSNSGLPVNFVEAIEIDSKDVKWIGTWTGGIASFDNNDWVVYNSSNSDLLVDTIYDIAIDKNDTKWIGTWSGGVTAFTGNTWTTYTTTNSPLPDNDVYCIAIDAENKKWFGTLGGGIACFDNSNWIVYNENNSGLPADNIQSIAIDGSGNVWIGTNPGGVACFNGTNWQVFDSNNSELPNNDVNAIAIQSINILWFGTGDGGVAKYIK